jgi:hypothetical protein
MGNHMKTTSLLIALGLSFPLTASAQSQPSAKATAKFADYTLIQKTSKTSDWVDLLSQTVKTPNGKELMVNASLEVGLYTQTQVKSKGMVSDTSSATVHVDVRVLVDGREILPGVVIYGRRTQTLSATLEGAIADCLYLNDLGEIALLPDCAQPEIIELIQDTITASSFNFVTTDLTSGVHTVLVQARIDNEGSAQEGSWSAEALVGKGAVTVETVRMIKNEDVVDLP